MLVRGMNPRKSLSENIADLDKQYELTFQMIYVCNGKPITVTL
jgi:hypothetical protein